MSSSPVASVLDAARRACQDDVLKALEDHVEKCWQCKRAFKKDDIVPISFTCSCVMALCNQCAGNELGKSKGTYTIPTIYPFLPFIFCPKCPPEDDSACTVTGGMSIVSNSTEELGDMAKEERRLFKELQKLLDLKPPLKASTHTRRDAYTVFFSRLERDVDRDNSSPWKLEGLVTKATAHAEESQFSHPVCTLLLARCMALIEQKQREQEEQQHGSRKASEYVISINNLDTDLPPGPLKHIRFESDLLILNVSRTLQEQSRTANGVAQLREKGFESNIGLMSPDIASDACLTCSEAFPLSPPCKYSCSCFSVLICVKCQLDRLAADMTPRSFVAHAGGDKGTASDWNDETLSCCICREKRLNGQPVRNPRRPVISRANILLAAAEVDEILKGTEIEKGGPKVQRALPRSKQSTKTLFENLLKYIQRYDREDGVDFRFSFEGCALSLAGHVATYGAKDSTVDADRDLEYFKVMRRLPFLSDDDDGLQDGEMKEGREYGVFSSRPSSSYVFSSSPLHPQLHPPRSDR